MSMAGSMREKRPGVFELRAYAGRDPVTGKHRYQSRTFRGSNKAADKALSLFVAEVTGGTGGTKATLGALLDDWLRLIGPSRSAKTIDGYRRLIEGRIRPTLGDTPLNRLEPHTLDVWYAQLHAGGLSPRSVRNVHAIIRAALNQAVKWGWVERNVAELATPPSVPADPRKRFSDEDILRVLAATMERDPGFGVLVLTAAALGCRRGEVCGLRWSDIDLDAGLVRIHRAVVVVRGQLIEQGTKTHQERTVAIDAGTVEALARHRAEVVERARLCEAVLDDGFVFTSDPAGRVPLNPDRVSHTWQRECRRQKVEGVRFHDLRHWHATYLLGQRIPLELVSERLGHRLKSTTSDVYSHAVPGHDELAAASLGQILSPKMAGSLPRLQPKAIGDSHGGTATTPGPGNEETESDL